MAVFDRNALRETVLGDCGYKYYLASSFEEFQAEQALTLGAASSLQHAVACLLVDLQAPGMELLEKTRHWLQVAIASNEQPRRYERDYTEAYRFEMLSLCNWLIEAKHDTENLRHAVQYLERYVQSVRPDAADLSYFLPLYLDAGENERIKELFELTPRLSPPKNLTAIRSDAVMCYVLACQRLEAAVAGAEMQTAVNKFLNRNMSVWLSHGQRSHMVRWMKIVYWQQGGAGLTPTEALLKCFEHVSRNLSGAASCGVRSLPSHRVRSPHTDRQRDRTPHEAAPYGFVALQLETDARRLSGCRAFARVGYLVRGRV